MEISARSYLTAGVAALGAATIAVAPVQPLPSSLAIAPHQASALAVELAATFDPITPWVNVIDNTANNILGLVNIFTSNPFPITQQIALNQLTYFSELPDFGAIFSQIGDNISNAFGAPFAETPLNINPEVTGEVLSGPLDHYTFYVLTMTPEFGILTPEQIDQIKPIFDFLTQPITGVALGLVGPLIAPVLAVVESVGAIVDALGDSDFLGAINELINIPANLVNAVLNGGQFLDVAPLLNLAGVELPSIITRIGLTMGGLLSQGAWQDPTRPSQLSSSGPGVAFDALDLAAEIVSPFTTSAVLGGLPIGPIGALLGLNNQIANSIVAVTPGSTAAVQPAAAEGAPAPELAAAPDTTTEDSVAVDEPPVVADEPDEEAPAPAPKRGRAAAGSDNSGNDTAKRASSRGTAKSASARGAR